jgi:hypothetical protein
MRFILICAGVLVSLSGVAQNEVRFTPASSLTSATITNIKEKSAVHLLESSNGQCTSTTLSSLGHQLTARHCLQHCLIRSKVFKMNSLNGAVTYFDTDPTRLGQAQCEVSIDHSVVEITIEATSPGLIVSMDEAGFKSLNPQKFKDLQARGYTSEGDFVIFLPKKGSLDKSVCIPFSKRKTISYKLQTLGYPWETLRPDGFNANGTDMYFSQGHPIAGIEDNQCVKEFSPSAVALDNLKASFNQQTSFMSTLDATYGSSGTAVVDETKKIVGILMQTHRQTELTKKESDEPDRRYCKGSAKALKMTTILQYVSESLLSQLNCD